MDSWGSSPPDDAAIMQEMLFWVRLMAVNTTNNTASNSTGSTTAGNDSAVLRNSVVVYGSISLGLFLLFCWLRLRYPRPFTIRQWVDKIKTPLADNQYGFFSWLWKLGAFTDEEIMETCSLDALCFLRALRMGYRISLLGIFNAIWLMPLYDTAPPTSNFEQSPDSIVQLTIANVFPGSPRLIGTALAAYFLFGYVMYLILQELDWLIEMRHKFLRRRQVRNYAVHVRNVPSELLSTAALADFLQHCFVDPKALHEVMLRVMTPQLSKLVQKRANTLGQLDHALLVEQKTGVAPMHRNLMALPSQQMVDTIDTSAAELKELNETIKQRIMAIEVLQQQKNEEHRQLRLEQQYQMEQPVLPERTSLTMNTMDDPSGNTLDHQLPEAMLPEEADEKRTLMTTPYQYSSLSQHSSNKMTTGDQPAHFSEHDPPRRLESGSLSSLTGTLKGGVKDGVKLLSSSALAAAKGASNLILGGEDGGMYSAGFVTFNSLSATNAALQMVHDPHPFCLEVFEAPDPDDVFWPNVGRTHKDLQLGGLASMAATAALCLLWTIPITFFASLSNVDNLRKKVKFIDTLLEDAPFLEPVVQLLAPYLVVILNSLLPAILERLSMMEGPVSGAVVGASTFSKLAAFMIIQTFFVSAISGSLLQTLSNFASSPDLIIDLLATSLPNQSTYFMQITIVGTVVAIGMETLRVVPLVMALLRKCIGPKLSEKERQTTFLGIRPLADPVDFGHADVMAKVVFYFMVTLVYQVIAPLTSFVMAVCFIYNLACYRHQFVFIYPYTPDSGGKIMTRFIKILCICMLIAEITLLGLLALKKSPAATPLMLPLVIITFLFNGYIRQQHFRVVEFLPSRDCIEADRANENNDTSFLDAAYIQPELKEKEVFPENLSLDRALTLNLQGVDANANVTVEVRDSENP